MTAALKRDESVFREQSQSSHETSRPSLHGSALSNTYTGQSQGRTSGKYLDTSNNNKAGNVAIGHSMDTSWDAGINQKQIQVQVAPESPANMENMPSFEASGNMSENEENYSNNGTNRSANIMNQNSLQRTSSTDMQLTGIELENTNSFKSMQKPSLIKTDSNFGQNLDVNVNGNGTKLKTNSLSFHSAAGSDISDNEVEISKDNNSKDGTESTASNKIRKRIRKKKDRRKSKQDSFLYVIRKHAILTTIGVGSTIVAMVAIGVFSMSYVWYVFILLFCIDVCGCKNVIYIYKTQ